MKLIIIHSESIKFELVCILCTIQTPHWTGQSTRFQTLVILLTVIFRCSCNLLPLFYTTLFLSEHHSENFIKVKNIYRSKIHTLMIYFSHETVFAFQIWRHRVVSRQGRIRENIFSRSRNYQGIFSWEFFTFVLDIYECLLLMGLESMFYVVVNLFYISVLK